MFFRKLNGLTFFILVLCSLLYGVYWLRTALFLSAGTALNPTLNGPLQRVDRRVDEGKYTVCTVYAQYVLYEYVLRQKPI